jgi:hypothetical protein
MNYKTMLLASAAVMFASQAMAQDLTGAFSVPGKGQIMSETTAGLTRTKTNIKEKGYGSLSMIQDGRYMEETLEYGITDNFSINGSIANAFDVDTQSDVLMHIWGEDYNFNNDHNFMYTLGAKYNMRFDDVLFQVAGEYETWQPTTWFGHKTGITNKWQKNLGIELKAGLDLGNGLTPYIVYHIDSDIDTAHRELLQSVSVGVHKYAGKWALDGAIRYEWTKNHVDAIEGHGWKFKYNKKNTTETWLDVAGDYYLKDNIALGLYGSYLIDARDRAYNTFGEADAKERTLFDYEVGLRVKVLF